MGDLRWIKIATDIFEDEKMLVIESRPDGNKMVLIWFKLLCLAGKKSGTGVFTIGGKPYTDELFSIVFRLPIKEVSEALDLFESLGMITRERGIVAIKNWKKHQSVDELERVREQTRARVAKHREKQKIQAAEMENSAPKSTDVTLCNGECNAIEKNRVDKSRIEENRVDESRAAESRSDESNVSSPSASTPPHTAAEGENVGFADRGYAFGEVADRCSEGILRPGIPVTDEYDEADIPPPSPYYFPDCPDNYFLGAPMPFAEYEKPRESDNSRGEREEARATCNDRYNSRGSSVGEAFQPIGDNSRGEREEARATCNDRYNSRGSSIGEAFQPIGDNSRGEDCYTPREPIGKSTFEDTAYPACEDDKWFFAPSGYSRARSPASGELKSVSGKGRGVVMLTDEQISSLEERLGYDTYQGYLDRLSSFIIEKRAKIKNHYETILKWYEEDKNDGTAAARERGNKAAENEKNAHRQGSFDPDEAFRYALARSNALIEETY